MHVAICDDNVADRKQIERLLGKGMLTAHLTNEGLYVDSYGNRDALLHNPMLYDIFFLDLCNTPDVTGASVARELIHMGVQAPVYLCCSSIDYRKEDLPEHVFFLQKPFRMEDLSDSLLNAITLRANKVPVIELRDDVQTIYVTKEDILYAIEKSPLVHIYLKDGRQLSSCTTRHNLLADLQGFENFCPVGKNLILNLMHITSFQFSEITMCDEKTFRVSPFAVSVLKKRKALLPSIE